MWKDDKNEVTIRWHKGKPPREGRYLLRYEIDKEKIIYASGEYRYGHDWEPQPGSFALRNDCCGRFGGFVSWAELPEFKEVGEPTGKCPNCGGWCYDGGYCCSETCEEAFDDYLAKSVDALQGGEVIDERKVVRCPHCEGSGSVFSWKYTERGCVAHYDAECCLCEGRGLLRVEPCEDDNVPIDVGEANQWKR